MKPAILSGSMAIPVASINVAQLRKDCTLRYRPMGAEKDELVHAYYEADGYIHVPRQLGLRICRRNSIPYEDQTSAGFPVSFPRLPEPREYQIDPLVELGQIADDYFDFLFRARTGWGKTVGGLLFAARRGRTTLILVDQDNLKDQWIAALKQHFGLTDENIGIVQGKVCKYEGCPVTIAMVQTLVQRQYPPEFYAYFGTLIPDEVHCIGAPTFSQILFDFPATCRVGISATPKRRDGLQKALDYHLGRVRLYVDDEHQKNSVWIAETESVFSFYANTSPKMGRFINEIAEDAERNLLLSGATQHLYDMGHDVLVLSDRIEHLKSLMVLCEYQGIPEEDMGLYAGYNPVYRLAKDATPPRRPMGYERGTEYTPVALQSIAKRTKVSTLDDIKKNARIVFATYGMFQKGVDVPRLTGGVDASPRSTAEQVHGRILRGEAGSTRSIWITIADINSYRSVHGCAQRLTDYLGNNAELFHWSLEEGEIPCHGTETVAEYRDLAKRLRSMRIEMDSDGLLTLLTPTSHKELVMQRVSDIKAAHRSQSPSSAPRANVVRSTGRVSTTRSLPSATPSPRRRRL